MIIEDILSRFYLSRVWLTFPIAAVFALAHVFGPKLTFLEAKPRSVWLSFAGGIGVAYVFVHVLPELSRNQRAFDATSSILDRHIWTIALVGIVTFYGLEHGVRAAMRRQKNAGGGSGPSNLAFWIHLLSFAIYNVLLGYVLVARNESGLVSLALYSFALTLHFIVNDFGLREAHGDLYDTWGRWVLAVAPLLGWATGTAIRIDEQIVAAMFGFLGGGLVLNVLKEELPEERESRFLAFAIGAFLYAGLLLITR